MWARVKEGVALRSDVGSAEEEKKQSYGLPDCGVFCVFAKSLPSIPDNYRRAAKWMNVVIGCACLTEQ
jgi:hypothetical protein